MSGSEGSIRDRISQNDVTIMRSYLEVDVAEWLSRNEIPFAYEPFVIPSVVGPDQDRWSDVVDAIQKVGAGERDSIEMPNGEIMDAFDILSLWNDIYSKHQLAQEQITIEPNPALERFSKKMVLPDFAIYRDFEGKQADDDFEWGEYDYLIEVSGLYGVGIPGESDDDEWWDWYRVSGVAFKEFVYRLLGLWDRVRWVIPNQGSHDSTSTGLPGALRNDNHYVIMDTTQFGIELKGLAQEIGIVADALESGLSPEITPTKYNRPLQGSDSMPRNQITPEEYTFSGTDTSVIQDNSNAVLLEDGIVLYHGELGEVYIFDDGTVRVRESQWRGSNMIMVREFVLDSLSKLSDDGIVEGLSKV